MESTSAQHEGIKVCVRVRPLNAREKERENIQEPVWTTSSTAIGTGSGVSFEYDHVFTPPCTNFDLFQEIGAGLAKSAVDGFNAVIFAYGQTSSGKTHTMLGNESDPGITPLAVRDVFGHVVANNEREFLIRVSYIEIYNEVIKDLLCPGQDNLKIHEDFTGRVFVDAREEVVTCAEDVLKIMSQGEEQRTFGSTNMNESSSRSHTIFTLFIESRLRTELSAEDGVAVCASTLSLVDLAGSERVSHTGAEGVRLKEGGHINKSLLTLGTVINKLSEGASSHIPYRDSKLTRILQPALGGNARTSVICAVTPARVHVEETVSTLKFASRAKHVQNRTSRIEILDDRAMLRRCQKEVERLKEQLAHAGSSTGGKVNEEEIARLQDLLATEATKCQELIERNEKLSRMLATGGEDDDSADVGSKRSRTWRRHSAGGVASDNPNRLSTAEHRDYEQHIERLAHNLAAVEKRTHKAVADAQRHVKLTNGECQALRNELSALAAHAEQLEKTRKLAVNEADSADERVAAAEVVSIFEEITGNAIAESERRSKLRLAKSLHELKEEKQKSQKELEVLQRREKIGIAPLQKQVETQKQKLGDADAKLKAAKSQCSRLETEKLQLDRDMKALEKQLRSMEAIRGKDLEKATRELEKAKESELRAKVQQIESLTVDVQKVKSENAAHLDEQKRLQDSLLSAEAVAEKSKAELAEALENARKLETNVADLKIDSAREQRELQESVRLLEENLVAASETSSQQQADLERCTADLSRALEQIKLVKEESNRKEAELNEALSEEVEETRFANERAGSLTNELEAARASLEAVERELTNEKKTRQDVECTRNEAVEQIRKLSEELDMVKADASSLQEAAESEVRRILEEKLAPAEEELQAVQKKLVDADEAKENLEKRLQQDTAEWTRKLQESEDQQDHLRAEMASLQQRLNEEGNRASGLEQDLELANRKHADLLNGWEEKEKHYEAKVSSLEKESRLLREALSDQQVAKGKFEAEMMALMETATTEAERLKDEVKHIDAERSRVRDELKSQSEETEKCRKEARAAEEEAETLRNKLVQQAADEREMVGLLETATAKAERLQDEVKHIDAERARVYHELQSQNEETEKYRNEARAAEEEAQILRDKITQQTESTLSREAELIAEMELKVTENGTLKKELQAKGKLEEEMVGLLGTATAEAERLQDEVKRVDAERARIYEELQSQNEETERYRNDARAAEEESRTLRDNLVQEAGKRKLQAEMAGALETANAEAKRLQDEVKKVDSERARVCEELESQREDAEKSRSAARAAEEEAQTLRQKIIQQTESTRSREAELTAEMELGATENMALKEELQRADAERALALQEAKSLRELDGSNRSAASDAAKELQLLREIATQETERATALQEEMENASKIHAEEVRTLKLETERADSDSSRARKELEALQAAADAQHSKASKTEEKARLLRDALAQKEADAAALRENLGSSDDAHRTQTESLERRLAEVDAACAQLEERGQSLSALAEQSEAAASAAKSELLTLREALGEQKASSAEEMTALKDELQKVRAERSSLCDEIESLREIAAKHANPPLEEAKGTTTASVEESEARVLRDELERHRAASSSAEAEVARLRAEDAQREAHMVQLTQNLTNLKDQYQCLKREAAEAAKEKVRLLDRYQETERRKRKLEMGLETWESGSGRVGTLERKLQRREIKVKKLTSELKKMEELAVLEGRAKDWLDASRLLELETRADSAELESQNLEKRISSLEAEKLALLKETHQLRDVIAARDRALAEVEVQAAVSSLQTEMDAENDVRNVAKPPKIPAPRRPVLREIH